jgi:hypothetical protein
VAATDPFFSTLDFPRTEGIVFDGFPYLIVHPAVGLNEIILLPARLSDDSLQWIAHQQLGSNRLPVSLVLSPDRNLHYPAEGGAIVAFRILLPGFPVAGSIQPCVRLPMAGELLQRSKRLEEFIAEHPANGFRFGNPWKGGRDATIDEMQWLFGRDADGVPRGLRKCPDCGYWNGECLDSHLRESLGEEVVVPVTCRCENWNRCARCHENLEAFRLDSNFFDPEGGKIWFVPGICALQHRCRE